MKIFPLETAQESGMGGTKGGMKMIGVVERIEESAVEMKIFTFGDRVGEWFEW